MGKFVEQTKRILLWLFRAGLIAVQLCLGTSILITPQEELLDKACERAVQGNHREEALKMLESIAIGDPRDKIEALAQEAGLREFVEAKQPLDDFLTRREALGRIGDTGLPEAERFLSAVTESEIGQDPTQQIYQSAKLVLTMMIFRREKDPEQQIAFLERLLTSPGFARNWAVDELCDRGNVASLPAITASIKRQYPNSTGDELVAYCQARMDIVNRDANRALAIGSVLRVDVAFEDQRIMNWAITQLSALNSAEADAILDRYAADVETAFRGVPGAGSIPQMAIQFGYVKEIRRIRVERAAKASRGLAQRP
jgi:hypothetical protein